MKIGILGGTFDPIHNGHLTLARESVRQFQLEKILFVPASRPPHKAGERGLTAAGHRARMVEIAIAGAEEEGRWELSDLELTRSGVSYTVDTLRQFRKLYPSPDLLYFLAGADSLAELPQWKEPKEILRLADWIVAPRPSVVFPKPLPAQVHWLKMETIPISASEVRAKLERGEDVSLWIPKKVKEYIDRMKLYPGNFR